MNPEYAVDGSFRFLLGRLIVVLMGKRTRGQEDQNEDSSAVPVGHVERAERLGVVCREKLTEERALRPRNHHRQSTAINRNGQLG